MELFLLLDVIMFLMKININISIIEIMFQNYFIFHMNYVLKVCFDMRDM
jgi:hypothetical protein